MKHFLWVKKPIVVRKRHKILSRQTLMDPGCTYINQALVNKERRRPKFVRNGGFNNGPLSEHKRKLAPFGSPCPTGVTEKREDFH